MNEQQHRLIQEFEQQGTPTTAQAGDGLTPEFRKKFEDLQTRHQQAVKERDERARTHIKAVMQAIKDGDGHKAAQPAGLFMSGMLTGLASGVEILDGGTAEKALETVSTRLAAATGEACLAGHLPPRTEATADVDHQLTPEQEVRGVQGWMALDLHRALGLAVDDQDEHQGHRNWGDWWATLCAHVAQRTHATQARARALATPDDITARNDDSGWHPSGLLTPDPEEMFFPVGYTAAVGQPHPISPNDPPYMIDLSGYTEGDPLQERVHRLIVHRSLVTSLVRDLAALDQPAPDTAAAEALEPGILREQIAAAIYELHYAAAPQGDTWRGVKEDYLREAGVVLSAITSAAEREFTAEQGSEASTIEQLGYHAAGLSYDLERVEAERNGAYRERAHLVALVAAMTDGAVIAPAPDVEEPGWQIVYLTIGGRQASWHISPRDAELFECVEHASVEDPRAQWDGHSTDDKYARIRQHTRLLFHQCGPACAEAHTYTGRCEGAPAIPQVDDSSADAVTAETKRLMERRTTTLRKRAERAEAAIARVRLIKKAPSRSPINAYANAQDDGWDQALDAVHAALGAPERCETKNAGKDHPIHELLAALKNSQPHPAPADLVGRYYQTIHDACCPYAHSEPRPGYAAAANRAALDEPKEQ